LLFILGPASPVLVIFKARLDIGEIVAFFLEIAEQGDA
jgi:hypothetical protein